MKIGCVYTVEAYNSIEQPMGAATQIPYGISLIATVLNDTGHDVELFVITPDTPLDEYIGKYIEDERPSLFCLTAVSTQYEMAKKVSRYITQTDDTIFCILGGHHSSLNSEKVIREGVFDAIAIKRNAIPLFGKTIPKSLHKKIIEKQVTDIYIALDKDAISDSLKMVSMFLNEGRNVFMIELDEGKDPSSLGFTKFTKLMNNTQPINQAGLLKYKLQSI